jgi:hypothetical protein
MNENHLNEDNNNPNPNPNLNIIHKKNTYVFYVGFIFMILLFYTTVLAFHLKLINIRVVCI